MDGPEYTYMVYWLGLPDHEARMVAFPPSGTFAVSDVIDRLYGAITLLEYIVVGIVEVSDVVDVVCTVLVGITEVVFACTVVELMEEVDVE